MDFIIILVLSIVFGALGFEMLVFILNRKQQQQQHSQDIHPKSDVWERKR